MSNTDSSFTTSEWLSFKIVIKLIRMYEDNFKGQEIPKKSHQIRDSKVNEWVGMVRCASGVVLCACVSVLVWVRVCTRACPCVHACVCLHIQHLSTHHHHHRSRCHHHYRHYFAI